MKKLIITDSMLNETLLDINKSCCLDQIIPHLGKEMAIWLIVTLSIVFNTSLQIELLEGLDTHGNSTDMT